MEQKQKLHLTGYFDSNFGDDMMMKLVVRSLPDVTFVVDKDVDTPVVSEKNVVLQNREDCAACPKLIVTGCGFMINSKDVLKVEVVEFLKGYHPGDYCLGCNIEPLDSTVKRFLIRKKMNKFKMITCRDQISYQWIRKNTRKPEVHRLPDILFSIPDEWIPKEKVKDNLGISLMHRVGDREDCAYYRMMAEIADEWICKTGKKVILMAFDSGKEDDVFSCIAVKKLMKYSDCTEIIVHKDCTEILEAFARCEKVIAARFHAIVLALRMEIPVYPLIFREKARNLLKDIQYPFPSCDLDHIDRTSLQAFVEGTQKPYEIEKDIYVRANEHAKLLKQQLIV